MLQQRKAKALVENRSCTPQADRLLWQSQYALYGSRRKYNEVFSQSLYGPTLLAGIDVPKTRLIWT